MKYGELDEVKIRACSSGTYRIIITSRFLDYDEVSDIVARILGHAKAPDSVRQKK